MNRERSEECAECVRRGKTWQGSDARCAFLSGVFDTHNWNCATMNLLRDIVERHERAVYNEDEWAGIVVMDGGFIVMTWYKRRGRTSNAIVIFDDAAPRPLTLEDAEQAIAHDRAA